MRNYRAIQRIFSNRLYVLKKVIPTVLKKELFIILPYLGNMSSNLKQNLRPCFKNSLPQCKSTNSFFFCF